MAIGDPVPILVLSRLVQRLPSGIQRDAAVALLRDEGSLGIPVGALRLCVRWVRAQRVAAEVVS